MEEWLLEAETTTRQLATIVAIAGWDFDRTAFIRALAAYAARTGLGPDLCKLRFASTPPKYAPCTVRGGMTTDQSRIREIVALLSAEKLEVEQMHLSLIPPLTLAAVDGFLLEALPYGWMTTMAAVLKGLALEDATGAWDKQALPATVWCVLNE